MAQYINDGRPIYQSPPKRERKGTLVSRQKRQRMNAEAEYLATRDVYLEQNPKCVRCGAPATQIHHIVRGTAGKDRSRLNPDTWLGVCGSVCHDKVERLKPEQQIKLKQMAVKETIERLRR